MRRDKNSMSFLELFFSFFAVVILIASIFFINPEKPDPTVKLLLEIVKLFLSLYIAYVITRHYSARSAREDLTDIGIASGKRIFQLSAHIKELANEISTFEPDGINSKIHYKTLISNLNRLASDAELSFQDMQQIAKLDISIPEIINSTQERSVYRQELEVVKCPYCDSEKEIVMSSKAGTTKQVVCPGCKKVFNYSGQVKTDTFY